MSNSNGKISVPISVTDIKTVLGVNNNDIGYLCSDKHGRINIWSKYKPVKYPKVVSLDESDFKQANYGFVINANNSNNFTDSWSYDPPTGGAQEPFRMGDFREYMHTEGAPININSEYLNQVWNAFESSIPSLSVTPAYRAGNTSIGGSVNNRLKIEDLKISNNGTWQFKDLYFGIAYKSGEVWHIVNAPNALGEIGANFVNGISSVSGWSLETLIKNMNFDTEITIYPFLNTRTGKETNNNGSLGYIVPLPQLQPIKFKKIRQWWLTINPGSINLNYEGRFNIDIIQRSDNGYTNLSSIKSAIQNSPDTGVMEMTVNVNLSKSSLLGQTGLDLKEVQMNSSLIPNGQYVNISSMTVVSKMTYSSATSAPSIERIDQRIDYNASPTVNTNYEFVGITPYNTYPRVQYAVTFKLTNIPVSVLKANANADNSQPSGQRFYVNTNLRINGTVAPEGIFLVPENRPYRFKQV